MYHEATDKKYKYGKLLLILVILAVIVLICLFSYRHFAGKMTTQNIDVIENTVKQAAVQCYAVEGVYPNSVEYLEQNYGLIINHEKYIVTYEAFSSNLMPNVSVLVKNSKK